MKRAQRTNSAMVVTVKTLALAVSGLMLSQSVGHASDTELYKAASAGGAKVMLLLDNSGSMGPASLIDDYGIRCGSRTNLYFIKNGRREFVYTGFTKSINQPIYDNDDKPTGNTISYEVTYCDRDLYGKDLPRIYFDRLSRLKMALIPMLARPKEAFGNDADLSRYQIGLSSFFEKWGTGKSGGQIRYPVSPIDLANREKMLNIIAQIPAEGGTPSANALTEAGAYMLGTRTASSFKEVTITKEVGKSIRLRNGNYNVFRCLNDVYSGNYIQCGTAPLKSTYSSRDFSDDAVKDIIGDFNTKEEVRNGTVYYLMITKRYEPEPPHDYSGMDLAHPLAVKNNYYVSPINSSSDGTSQCDGNGLYFLTDGEPNGFRGMRTTSMMNLALTAKGENVPTIKINENGSCSSRLSNGVAGNDGGWACMGDFAKALNNENNPIKRKIAVGTAGFGDIFASLSGRSDCNSTSTDASNLCKLGKEGEGYGEGGFYYIQESTELADSIKDFIAKIGNKEVPAVSTGTMSVPLDVLSTSQSRGFAYTPILDPKPSIVDLWDGNLKKYYIRNGTVTADDAGAKKVFQDKTGRFAADTYDLWNKLTDEQPDKALPQLGGAYQNIFKNTDKSRNLYVNVNNKLTSIKVGASKKPAGFNDLRTVLRPDLPTVANSATDERTTTLDGILNNVLSFMGYPAQAAPALPVLDDSKTIVGDFDETKRNVGGVLHSIPQLVTYSIRLDNNGRFDPTTRKDSLIYGSMDGALHLIDDKTGQEQFTFIPKEILDLQPAALLKDGERKTVDNQLPYGVDAPWSTYAIYALSGASGKITDYKAAQIFAAGGLRMGGSAYYNLDITDPTKPRLIYSLGSNYANVLQGQASTLGGMRNASTHNTSGENAAFARMGQTWGKPAVGFVKVNGKRVMVNFLPGGYDMGYESATYKPTAAAPAQGNAVYMVQVGEQEADSNNVLVVKTGSDSGKLLWWTSYGSGKNHTNNYTTRSTNLQKSEHEDMYNSIVNEIRTVDRDYDGLTDHIYFADLGGRVWRADINNPKYKDGNGHDTGTFRVDRVVKILDVSDQNGSNDTPPRIYERPLFTVTDEVEKGTPMGQITVGTGDRSLPITDKRSKADAIYSFIDKDVFKKKFFCTKSETDCPARDAGNATLSTVGLTTGDLEQLTFTENDAKIKTYMTESNSANLRRQGWYYVLDQWNKIDGQNQNAQITNTVEQNVKGLKMFNEPDAQAGLLYISIFNPNINLMGGGCSATVQGATQRLLMCLPFGNCANSNYNNALLGAKPTQDFRTRSVALAGAGIIDNIITQHDPKDPDSLFTSLQLSCEGGSCDKPEDVKDAIRQGKDNESKTILDLLKGVYRGKLINPRNWWEK